MSPHCSHDNSVIWESTTLFFADTPRPPRGVLKRLQTESYIVDNWFTILMRFFFIRSPLLPVFSEVFVTGEGSTHRLKKIKLLKDLISIIYWRIQKVIIKYTKTRHDWLDLSVPVYAQISEWQPLILRQSQTRHVDMYSDTCHSVSARCYWSIHERVICSTIRPYCIDTL